jgi:hypothetical protein
MTESEILGSNLLYGATVIPRLLTCKFIICRVESHNRAEYTKLYPTNVKLVILLAHTMTTDIVAPPRICHIGCGSGKCGLIFES